MTVYTINYSDPLKSPIEVSTSTVNTSTGVFLIGKNSIGYGELIAENFLHLLENFASPTMPSSPVEGQLWYDTSNSSSKILKVNTGLGNNWKPVSNTFVQEVAPTTAVSGDLWIDKSSSIWNLKFYETDKWISVGPAVDQFSANTATIYSTFIATGTVSLFGSVNISGTSTISGPVTVNDAIKLNDTATVSDIIPYMTNQYSIGNTDARFENIYGNNIYGELNSISDARDKANVRNTVLGLNFINELRPVDFEWDYRSDYNQVVEEITYITVQKIDEITGKITSEQEAIKTLKIIEHPKDGSKIQNGYHHGLIAQELMEASKKSGLEFGGYKIDEQGSFTVAYHELIAPMIKAIQELNKEVIRLSSIVENQVGKI